MINQNPLKTMEKGKLSAQVYETDIQLGEAAATFVAERLMRSIEQQGKSNMILATGTSQFTFLEALKKKDIDWSKITVFHLDEYINMPDQHPASFRKYLRKRILDEVKPLKINFIQGDADDIDKELERYENLLRAHPVDIACIGIGENGHIAFNDPPVADFNDPKLIKIVELDEVSRRQQWGEGWFKSLGDVPAHALSLTIPAIFNCNTISCAVPDERKAKAVYETLTGPINTVCPATILREHSDTVLFLDRRSAAKVM